MGVLALFLYGPGRNAGRFENGKRKRADPPVAELKSISEKAAGILIYGAAADRDGPETGLNNFGLADGFISLASVAPRGRPS